MLPDSAFTNTAIGAIYTLIDLLNAQALEAIADSREAVSTRLFTSSRKKDCFHSVIVSAAYLLNPFTIAACLGRSTSLFTNTAIIHSISAALEGDVFKATFALGFASYLSMYPALLLPPIALLCWDRTFKSDKPSKPGLAFGLNIGAVFLSTVTGLLGLSYIITGSWNFLPATYGFQLLVPDLTPNIGLWWYFFIEIFDSFRAFFLGVFWLHLAGYVGGLTIRLRTQPLFVVTTLFGLFAIFKPYPSISDVSLYFAFLPLYKHILPRKSCCQILTQCSMLTGQSYEILLHSIVCLVVCKLAGASFLLSMDIRRLGKCKFLLRHHSCMESWSRHGRGRLAFRRASR